MQRAGVVVLLTILFLLISALNSPGDLWIPIGQPGADEGIVDYVVKDETVYAVTYYYPTNNVYLKENCFDEQSQWQNITNNIELSPGEHLISIDVTINPQSPDSVVIFVGTNMGNPSRLWKSYDRGSTWTIAHEQTFFTYTTFIDPKDWHKVWVATWPGLIVSEDEGESWTTVNPPDSQYIYSICFDPVDSLSVYVSTVGFQPHYGSVFKTTDGGNNWMKINQGLPESIDWTTMDADPNVSGILYLVPTFFETPPWGDELSIYKTTTQGEWWDRHAVMGGQAHSVFRSAHILVNPCYPNIIYLGDSLPGCLFQSIDRGSTWTTIIDEPVMGIVIDKADPQKVYVAFEDGIRCYQDPLVAVEDSQESFQLPDGYLLLQNYPNPFNPNTQIQHQISIENHVILKIFNVMGQETITLVDDDLTAGSYTVTWNGRDSHEQEVSAGIYFCTMKAGELTQTRKMVLLR